MSDPYEFERIRLPQFAPFAIDKKIFLLRSSVSGCEVTGSASHSVCKINYQRIGATAVCRAQYFTARLLCKPCFCSVQPDAGDEAWCCFCSAHAANYPPRSLSLPWQIIILQNAIYCEAKWRVNTRDRRRSLDLVPNLCQRVQKQEGDILRRHTCSTISQPAALLASLGIFSMKRLFCRRALVYASAQKGLCGPAMRPSFLVFAPSVRYARSNFAYYLMRLRYKSCYWASEWAERTCEIVSKEGIKEIRETLYLLHCESWSPERAALFREEIIYDLEQSFTLCLFYCLYRTAM